MALQLLTVTLCVRGGRAAGTKDIVAVAANPLQLRLQSALNVAAAAPEFGERVSFRALEDATSFVCTVCETRLKTGPVATWSAVEATDAAALFMSNIRSHVASKQHRRSAPEAATTVKRASFIDSFFVVQPAAVASAGGSSGGGDGTTATTAVAVCQGFSAQEWTFTSRSLLAAVEAASGVIHQDSDSGDSGDSGDDGALAGGLGAKARPSATPRSRQRQTFTINPLDVVWDVPSTSGGEPAFFCFPVGMPGVEHAHLRARQCKMAHLLDAVPITYFLFASKWMQKCSKRSSGHRLPPYGCRFCNRNGCRGYPH
jgi:hypothetical protein